MKRRKLTIAVAGGLLAAGIVGGTASPAFAAWQYSGGYFEPKSACLAAANDLRAQGFTILQGCTAYYPSLGGWLLDARRWI